RPEIDHDGALVRRLEYDAVEVGVGDVDDPGGFPFTHAAAPLLCATPFGAVGILRKSPLPRTACGFAPTTPGVPMPPDTTTQDLLQLNQRLLDSIAQGDWPTYEQLCDPGLTAFEPESQGQLVEGL